MFLQAVSGDGVLIDLRWLRGAVRRRRIGPALLKLPAYGVDSRIGSRRSISATPPRRHGFALVVVIWGLGVIALLVTPFMSTARLRLQAAFNIAAATKADLIAQSAIDLAALSLLAEQNGALLSTHGGSGGGRANFAALQGAGVAQRSQNLHDGRPRSCVFEGAAVTIAIEDEAGKVDLNAAPAKLLKAMLTGLGAAPSQADYVANAIVAFRSNATGDIAQTKPEYADSGRPYGPKRASFQTIFELDQVVGVDAALFRQLQPFVTVHSRHPGVDSQSAPPALFAALTGASNDVVGTLMAAPFPNNLDRSDPRFPAPFKQDGEGAVFLVHVEALLASGQTVVREEIVDMNFAAAVDSMSLANAPPFAIREKRRGPGKFIEHLRQTISPGGVNLPPC